MTDKAEGRFIGVDLGARPSEGVAVVYGPLFGGKPVIHQLPPQHRYKTRQLERELETFARENPGVRLMKLETR